jgi:hypothetical protein
MARMEILQCLSHLLEPAQQLELQAAQWQQHSASRTLQQQQQQQQQQHNAGQQRA